MLVWGKSSFYTRKWPIPITLDWLLEFFLSFAQWMGLIVHRNIILIAYPKKNVGGQMGSLGSRMSYSASQLWIRCKDCFKILHNERGQERHGNYINGFSGRNLIQSNLVGLEQKWSDIFITLDLLSRFF